MPDPILYLHAMGAAGASTIFVLALGGLCCRLMLANPSAAGRQARLIQAACIAAIGLGLLVGYHTLGVRPTWPPANGLHRFLAVVLPAVIAIELMAAFPRVLQWLAWALRISLSLAAGRILLHGSVYLGGARGEWGPWQAGAMLTVCGSLLAAVWVLLAALCRRSPSVSIPLALSQAILCAGMTVMLAGYVAGGAAALPLASAVAAGAVGMSLVARPCCAERTSVQAAGLRGLIGIGVVGLFSLLFVGRFFGRLSTGRALVMLLAPLLCWAAELPMLRRQNAWLLGAGRLGIVAIPLFAVVAGEKRDFDRNTAPLLGKFDSSCIQDEIDRESSDCSTPSTVGPRMSCSASTSTCGRSRCMPR